MELEMILDADLCDPAMEREARKILSELRKLGVSFASPDLDDGDCLACLDMAMASALSCSGPGDILMHSAVIGELACGGFRNRSSILADLKRLPRADEARSDEIYRMIEERKLHGKGLGWVDCQLLASAALMEVGIQTRDQALADAATRLGLRA